ncbi:hypothetical protein LB467_08790 [Salegentibacter sp. JZCK2]|uniref:hypothetical protein n=1 Tax=Salegentibacter tibetensis TaxID=2873600 RepID=UPI001CD02618|nr:hypothetical protein [Salegentibacter tibetensis]MBZ9729786.1 hypothetical protein [Salegentibacter tibetensis]
MESNQNNKIRNKKTSTSTPPGDKEESKTAAGRFFSNVGYSIWIAVMVIGGVIAFLVSLLVL